MIFDLVLLFQFHPTLTIPLQPFPISLIFHRVHLPTRFFFLSLSLWHSLFPFPSLTLCLSLSLSHNSSRVSFTIFPILFRFWLFWESTLGCFPRSPDVVTRVKIHEEAREKQERERDKERSWEWKRKFIRESSSCCTSFCTTDIQTCLLFQSISGRFRNFGRTKGTIQGQTGWKSRIKECTDPESRPWI